MKKVKVEIIKSKIRFITPPPMLAAPHSVIIGSCLVAIMKKFSSFLSKINNILNKSQGGYKIHEKIFLQT